MPSLTGSPKEGAPINTGSRLEFSSRKELRADQFINLSKTSPVVLLRNEYVGMLLFIKSSSAKYAHETKGSF